MVWPRTLSLVLVLTAIPACFRDPPAGGDARAAPRELALCDPEGAAFEPGAAPRDLELRVGFGDDPPALAELSLLLVRGAFSTGLVSRMTAARLRSAAMERLVPLTFTRQGDQLSAHPEHALDPGARYTLLWLAPEQPAAFPVAISPSPTLGARLVETWPGADEGAAPPDLKRGLLRFDGHLAGDPLAHIGLRDAAAGALDVMLEVVRCSALGFPEGDCVWVTPKAPLAPGARYELAVGAGLRTLTGAPIEPASSWFTLAEHEDREPPALPASACASDETPAGALCVRAEEARLTVRGAVGETAWLSITLEADGSIIERSALSYVSSFELADVPLAAATTATLRARDLAGNVREQMLAVAAAPDLPTVSIEEMRADPLGKEPAQEYVELLNYGAQPVSLMGFTVSKDAFEKGRALTGAASLAPGERALVVGPDFDERDPSDGVLPSGVKLVRLEGALGLANAGARLFLRDRAGRRTSAATALTALLEGQCSARGASDRRRGDPQAFELDPDGGCTPGAPTFDRP